MKRIASKQVKEAMWSNTSGIANKIYDNFSGVYRMSHGSGTAVLVKDDDGQLYEIDVRPAHLGQNKDGIRQFLMQSENPQDKDTFYDLELQSARRSRPQEWPTGDNQ